MKSFLSNRKWTVELADLQGYLRYFFALAAVQLCFRLVEAIYAKDFRQADLLWPVTWIGWLSDPLINGIPRFLFLLNIILLPLVFWQLKRRWLRVSAAVVMFLLVALQNSFSPFVHSTLCWPVCALALAGCTFEKSKYAQELNTRLVYAACALFLSFYFIAGVHKLRDFFGLWFSGESFWDISSQFVPRTVQSVMAGPTPPLVAPSALFTSPSWFTVALFFGAMAFELGALLPILCPRWIRPWAFLIIGFHVFNLLVLNVAFGSTALAAVVVLMMHPMKQEF
jgi:hypothetical protein